MHNRYVFHARISERKFKELLTLFCADVPALTASSLTLVNRKTSQRIYEALRKRVVDLAMKEAKPFTGEVEIDESYFGPRRVRGRRGRGASHKTPVVGLLKRGGKVFTSVVANCSRAELEPIIKGQVLSKSTVYTDGWLGYDGLLLSGYKHHRIYHHENEFARGKNHVNGIESFGALPSFASPNCVACARSFSCFTSKNPSGVGTIDAIIFVQFSSKTCASNRSNLGKTQKKTGWRKSKE